MPKTTRYDQLSRLIRRDFERAQTFTNEEAIASGGREVFVNANDEQWRADNSTFAQYRPYNSLSIDNDSDSEVRVYLNSAETWFVDVSAGQSRRLETPMYFAYIVVDEQSSTEITADELQITVGKHIDSRELRLLEMAGMLNVGD